MYKNMATFADFLKQDIPSEHPAQTLREIFLLMRQLFDIYQAVVPELLPNDLLQLSHIFSVFNKAFIESRQDPEKLLHIQRDFIHDVLKMLNNFNLRISTFKEHESLFNSFKDDHRFTHDIWKDNPYFELLKRSYYLLRKYSLKLIYSLENIDYKTKQQLHFYVIYFLNYFSPTNYIWGNPEIIQATMASGGNNLLNGWKNYLEDLILNNGKLNVRMTDVKAFKVGKNLAITKGKVIFSNELMQLIQYEATTEKVYKTPIVFVPPWINKYYVLDLSEKNSLVKWLVDQGFTVFMISWVNPDAKLAHKEFSDYMLDGPIQALDIALKQTKADSAHMVGYCIGGTLLACTLAYMQAQNDQRAKSATFFMSLLNFSNPGEIGVFIDKPQLNALDEVMQKRGFLNGRLLDLTFNSLRPNELVWPYFVNSYLLGKPAKPFDILYWNADSANLPYKMYSFYLRNMYLENKLRKPNAITLNNVPINLNKINTPAFFVGAEKDHITLWKSIYSGLHLLSGPVEFILSESGHVRAVVNPPTSDKYGFTTNPKFKHANDYKTNSKEWLTSAKYNKGTWWIHWANWLKTQDGIQVPARKINPSIVIEDAPGTYVLRRI